MPLLLFRRFAFPSASTISLFAFFSRLEAESGSLAAVDDDGIPLRYTLAWYKKFNRWMISLFETPLGFGTSFLFFLPIRGAELPWTSMKLQLLNPDHGGGQFPMIGICSHDGGDAAFGRVPRHTKRPSSLSKMPAAILVLVAFLGDSILDNMYVCVLARSYHKLSKFCGSPT